jgi:prepilin-type N-terminal cleavage/methylation domain-containing protein
MTGRRGFSERGQERRGNSSGFTLLEILTVVIIIVILTTMIIPVVRGVQSKAGRMGCASNLKSLYVAASAYIVDHQQWPQIAEKVSSDRYSERWMEALRPYGVSPINWRCPAVERQLGNPLKRDPKDKRIDYFASPFGPQQRAAYQWSTQPWFIERSDAHGNGNLMIFPDGAVKPLGDIVKRRR